MNHIKYLKSLCACSEAVAFASTKSSLQEAWETCPRADWMLWLLRNAGHRDDKNSRLFACWCVRNTPLADGRTTWDLVTDPRSRKAVEVAERFAVGEATSDQLVEARRAAAAAYAAACAYAAYAAYAAACAAYAAYTAYTYAALKAQSDQLRIVYPWASISIHFKV